MASRVGPVTIIIRTENSVAENKIVSLTNHDGNGNVNVCKRKSNEKNLFWGTFLCRPLQNNNVK